MAYYFGWEALAEWGVESTFGTAVTPTDGFSYLRSASFEINENTEKIFNIGGGTGRAPDSAVKGIHEVTGSLEMWMPDDLDSTTLDAWFIKMGLDAFNVAYSAANSAWVIPNTGTSVYPSNSLASFTLEIGHNKTGTIRNHILSGCTINSMTVKASKEEKVTFTFEFMAQDASSNNSSFTNGTATRSSSAPFQWAHCAVGYADDGASPTTRTDITDIEFTFEHNLVSNYDLSAVTPRRAVRNFIPEALIISGTMTVNLTTDSGMELYTDLLNDASAPLTPAETVASKAISLTVSNTAAANQKLTWVLRNVNVPNLAMDIDPEVHQEISVPFVAQYYLFTLNSTDATAPTNWDDQS